MFRQPASALPRQGEGVSRFGANPKPTVIVRMEENDRNRQPQVRLRGR